MNKNTLLLVFGFIILWNSGFIGAEYGIRYAAPMTLLFWRYLLLAAILSIYLTIAGKFKWTGFANTYPHFIIGILSHAVWLGCVLLSLQYGVPAGIVALVVALQPLTTGLFSGMAAGEPTSGVKWAGLITGFAGVALAVIPRIDFTDSGSVFGYLIPLGSVIAITVATLYQRSMDVRGDDKLLPPDLELFYQSVATTIVLFFPALFWEGMSAEWTGEFVYAIFWLVIGVSGGAYLLMWILIERIDATRVASLFYLGPPVTMLMAWAVFGDVVIFTDVAGLVVIFTGVAITYLGDKFKRKSKKNTPGR